MNAGWLPDTISRAPFLTMPLTQNSVSWMTFPSGHVELSHDNCYDLLMI